MSKSLVITVLTLLLSTTAESHNTGTINSKYEVCYSPKGGCTDMIVDFITNSTSDVWVLAYVFTSDRIADALIQAAHAGRDVQVIVDKNAQKVRGNDVKKLVDAGLHVWVDKKHPISHSKVIISGDSFETGSFNFSNAAEKTNQENAVIFYSTPELTKHYREFFEDHRSHSVKLN